MDQANEEGDRGEALKPWAELLTLELNIGERLRSLTRSLSILGSEGSSLYPRGDDKAQVLFNSYFC